jgi:hypothetical protein
MAGMKAIAKRADPIAARGVDGRGSPAMAAGSSCERFHKARNRHPRRCGAQGYA